MIFEEPEREWSHWDFRLVKAFQIREEMLMGGVPIYLDRSDRVRFEVESFVSKSKAALDRAEEKASNSKQKTYGKIFYPVPKTVDGGPLPTLEEWLEEQRRKNAMKVGNIRLGGEFDNAQWSPDQG